MSTEQTIKVPPVKRLRHGDTSDIDHFGIILDVGFTLIVLSFITVIGFTIFISNRNTRIEEDIEYNQTATTFNLLPEETRIIVANSGLIEFKPPVEQTKLPLREIPTDKAESQLLIGALPKIGTFYFLIISLVAYGSYRRGIDQHYFPSDLPLTSRNIWLLLCLFITWPFLIYDRFKLTRYKTELAKKDQIYLKSIAKRTLPQDLQLKEVFSDEESHADSRSFAWSRTYVEQYQALSKLPGFVQFGVTYQNEPVVDFDILLIEAHVEYFYGTFRLNFDPKNYGVSCIMSGIKPEWYPKTPRIRKGAFDQKWFKDALYDREDYEMIATHIFHFLTKPDWVSQFAAKYCYRTIDILTARHALTTAKDS